jgi:hypothetical protein
MSFRGVNECNVEKEQGHHTVASNISRLPHTPRSKIHLQSVAIGQLLKRPAPFSPPAVSLSNGGGRQSNY